MKTIKLSNSLDLPLSIATAKTAFIGCTGSGKTYGLGKLAEGLHETGIQMVIIDPVGVWYGLRLAADGKKPGITIPVFGGLKGDIQLESTAGAMIADLIVDRTLSCVIDVSQFESDADRTRFCTAFAERLFFRKKSSPSPIHIIMEEGQELMPQEPQRGEEKMLHAFQRIWKIGRNFGIGGSIATQRPQEVNKKILNQSQTIFAFRLTGHHERAAMRLWIRDKDMDESLAETLPSLATGSCRVWSPELLKINTDISIGRKWTYDSSSTPSVTGSTAKVRPLAKIDIEDLGEQIKATVEKAKQDDPKFLRSEIHRLSKEIANLSKAPAVEIKTVEKPVFDASDRSAIEAWRNQLGTLINQANEMLGKIDLVLTKKTVNHMHPSQIAAASVVMRAPRPVNVESVGAKKEFMAHKTMSKCALTLLRVMCQFSPASTTRNKLALVSGYSIRSSTFANGLSELRVNGMFDQSGDDFTPTPSGLEAAGSFDPFPTGSDAVNYWINKVGKCAGALLRAVRDSGGSASRLNLSQATGYSISSSTFANGLSELRVMGLIESNSEHVWLNQEFAS